MAHDKARSLGPLCSTPPPSLIVSVGDEGERVKIWLGGGAALAFTGGEEAAPVVDRNQRRCTWVARAGDIGRQSPAARFAKVLLVGDNVVSADLPSSPATPENGAVGSSRFRCRP